MTLARSISDTFAGIAPAGVLAFIAAQPFGILAVRNIGGSRGSCVAVTIRR